MGDCRRKWQPAPVFLPGKSQGQGSLVVQYRRLVGEGQGWQGGESPGTEGDTEAGLFEGSGVSG